MNNDWFYWNYEPRSECIFIDDKKILLEPGKYIWIKTILFTNQKELESELIKLKIKF